MLGSVLYARLQRSSHSVFGLDNLHFRNLNVIADQRNAVWFDLLDGDTVENLACMGFDVVVHLAALVGEPLCRKFPQAAFAVNSRLVRKLVSRLSECDPKPLFIFASTCSNYGVQSGLVGEDAALNPLGVYASSKVEAERAVMGYSPSVVLRFGTLFGGSPRLRLDILLNEWVKDAYLAHRLSVYGPEAYRPLIHVEDAAEAILAVIDAKDLPPRAVFNVAHANVRKLELAEAIQDLAPRTEVSVSEGVGDGRNYAVSSRRIEHELGFVASRSVVGGVSEMLKVVSKLPDPNTECLYNDRGWHP